MPLLCVYTQVPEVSSRERQIGRVCRFSGRTRVFARCICAAVGRLCVALPVCLRAMCLQPRQCHGVNCNNTSSWELLFDRSHFGDWQKIRLQEPSNSSSTSSSAVPRSIDVILRHELVDSVYAGDVVVASGALIALPDLYPLFRPGQLGRCVPHVTKSGHGFTRDHQLSLGRAVHSELSPYRSSVEIVLNIARRTGDTLHGEY